MEEYTKKLASFVLGIEYSDIPESTLQLAKKHFLDCVGCALGEVAESRSQILQRYFTEIGSTGDCRVIGRGRKLSVENVAFMTGILAHTICFDDSGPSHPSVTVVPALLALGEKEHFAGKDILSAQVIGYEVFMRLNAVTKDAWEMRQHGWHPTGFFGAVTSAMEVSKLLKLDVATTQCAAGIAATMGAGLSRNIGNMGMGLHAGNASRNGVTAAYLAKAGFDVDKMPLEGRFGLLDGLCGPGTYDISILTEHLDKHDFRLESPGITIKPYPNCWAHHKVLQAVLEMVAEHGIKPEMVDSILVDLQTGKPTYRYEQPETDLEARYSLAYGIALAVLDGKLTLEEYAPDRIHAESTLQMMKKIINTPQDSSEKQQEVTICLKSGKQYTHRVQFSKGHPKHDPMTMDEVKRKYRLCAGRILPEKQVERSMEMILSLDELDDLCKLIDVLIA